MTGPRARATAPDDAGALPMALLVTLVGMMVSGLLVSTVVGQIRATRSEERRTAALHAAQSGIDVIWARLGNVTSRSQLPCGPLAGSVSPAPPAGSPPSTTGATFTVLVDYFSADPILVRDSQLPPQPATAPGRIACSPTGGTPTTPSYALLRATGRDASGVQRTVRATYTFRVKRPTVVGGTFRQYGLPPSPTSPGIPDVCLDPATAPAVGVAVRAKDCDTPLLSPVFAYNRDLTLSLPATTSAAYPRGLCIDAGADTDNTVVVLRPCASPATPAQQWIYNGYANLMRPDNTLCLTTEGSGGNLAVVLGSRCAGSSREDVKWRPEPSVGAGAAGAETEQLVNFEQFGKCLDLISKRYIPEGLASVQTYPCTQAVPPAIVQWNQRWDLPVVPAGAEYAGGRVVVTSNETFRNDGDIRPHCLTTTTLNGYPSVTPCAENRPGTEWRVYGEAAGYEKGYTIVDGFGHCLAPKPTDKEHPARHQPVVVTTCDGSGLQKWNAPPYLKPPQPLKDVSER